jgi:hypothetical protein
LCCAESDLPHSQGGGGIGVTYGNFVKKTRYLRTESIAETSVSPTTDMGEPCPKSLILAFNQPLDSRGVETDMDTRSKTDIFGQHDCSINAEGPRLQRVHPLPRFLSNSDHFAAH